MIVYAGFTVGLDNVGLGLLGQSGFFDRVNVCFHHRSGIFAIEFGDLAAPVTA